MLHLIERQRVDRRRWLSQMSELLKSLSAQTIRLADRFRRDRCGTDLLALNLLEKLLSETVHETPLFSL